MPLIRSFQSLQLYDVLANLVPGTTVLLVFSALVRVEFYFQLPLTATVAGLFAVCAFVIGHAIQAFSSWLDSKIGTTPYLFGETIQAARAGNHEEAPINISHIESEVWPLMQRKFVLPSEFSDYGSLFRLLLSYIETTPATRALRFQAIHTFHRSMWGTWYLTLGASLLSLVFSALGLLNFRSIYSLFIVGSFSLMGILIFGKRKNKFNRLFVQYAIVDFYSDQCDHLRKD